MSRVVRPAYRLSPRVDGIDVLPAPLKHLLFVVLLGATSVVFPLYATTLGGAVRESITVLHTVETFLSGFLRPIGGALGVYRRSPPWIQRLRMGGLLEVTHWQADHHDETGNRGG